MTAQQFYRAVLDMRRAQKKYFNLRTQSALYEAKRLEALVDGELSRIESFRASVPEDPELFEQ